MTEDNQVVLDLLKSVISQTRWFCAECWVPMCGRLVVNAFYHASGPSESFQALESLTRNLGLKPSSCIPGNVWKNQKYEWIHDLTSFSFSPRFHELQQAGLKSAIGWPVMSANIVLGVIVLFSHEHVTFSEDILHSLELHTTSASKFFEHVYRQQNEYHPNQYLMNETDGLGMERASKPDSPTKKYANSIPRKPKFHERPIGFMIQLTTALHKCVDIPEELPDVNRTVICWNMFEQMCEIVEPWRDVLTRIRDVLKPALFSDDLMSSSDGLCMVKVPYFAQIPAAFEMNRRFADRAEEYRLLLDKSSADLRAARAHSDILQADLAALQRTLVRAQRRLVKLRLDAFLGRRFQTIAIRSEVEAETAALQARVKDLEQALRDASSIARHDFGLNTEEHCALIESARHVAVPGPAMIAQFLTPPTPAPIKGAGCDGNFPALSDIDKLREERRQLLLLRNGLLTDYERGLALNALNAATSTGQREAGGHGSGSVVTFAQRRAEFVRVMDQVQGELDALDEALRRAAAPQPPRAPLQASEVAAARKQVRTAMIYGGMSMLDSDLTTGQQPLDASDAENGGDSCTAAAAAGGGSADDEAVERERMREWTDAEPHGRATVDIWQGYRARRGPDAEEEREFPRRLDRAQVLRLVCEVFEAKANADADAGSGGPAAGGGDGGGDGVTMERTFYRIMDERYGSRVAADLAAEDVLHAVDSGRDAVRTLQLFARAMSGGWYDADWKYVLRTRQFAAAAAGEGGCGERAFRSLAAAETFLHAVFYSGLPPSEIDRFVRGLASFPLYSARPAGNGGGGGGGGGAGPVPAETLAEYVAYLLEAGEEPRVRKIAIVCAARGIGAGPRAGHGAGGELEEAAGTVVAGALPPLTGSTSESAEAVELSYADFEALADMCSPLSRRPPPVVCRRYFRMLARAHPGLRFPARSLVHSLAACELEALMAYHCCDPHMHLTATP